MTAIRLIRQRLFSTNKQRPLSLTKMNVLRNSQLKTDKNSLLRFANAQPDYVVLSRITALKSSLAICLSMNAIE